MQTGKQSLTLSKKLVCSSGVVVVVVIVVVVVTESDTEQEAGTYTVNHKKVAIHL